MHVLEKYTIRGLNGIWHIPSERLSYPMRLQAEWGMKVSLDLHSKLDTQLILFFKQNWPSKS